MICQQHISRSQHQLSQVFKTINHSETTREMGSTAIRCHWWGELLDRDSKPKCFVQANWERLAEAHVCIVFISQLSMWSNFSVCQGRFLDRESEKLLKPLPLLSSMSVWCPPAGRGSCQAKEVNPVNL